MTTNNVTAEKENIFSRVGKSICNFCKENPAYVATAATLTAATTAAAMTLPWGFSACLGAASAAGIINGYSGIKKINRMISYQIAEHKNKNASVDAKTKALFESRKREFKHGAYVGATTLGSVVLFFSFLTLCRFSVADPSEKITESKQAYLKQLLAQEKVPELRVGDVLPRQEKGNNTSPKDRFTITKIERNSFTVTAESPIRANSPLGKFEETGSFSVTQATPSP